MWLEPISPALDASQLGDALALNLTALSLLAMAVGLFLVFNAQRFVQSVRRPNWPSSSSSACHRADCCAG